MKGNNLMRVLLCKIHCPFMCFCKPPSSAARLYSSSGQLKSENTPHHHVVVVPSTVVAVSDDKSSVSLVNTEEVVVLSNRNQEAENVMLRSCIRKIPCGGDIGKKKVQWLDDLGKELTEIKEFESSETGDTDSEEESSRCFCVIL